MSDTTLPPFAPFQPLPTPPEKPVGKTKRSRKKPAVPQGSEPAQPEKRQRRKRAEKPAKRAPRYDLQTILKVAAALKEADQPVFEKLLGVLSELPKAGRERVLKALGEVFA